ncbi:MAG: tetratricopeptide repeat protein [Gemmatimonadota bacterium]|nr:tetratricopeptide repeat protein [Gemmatimonadota bacterium]
MSRKQRIARLLDEAWKTRGASDYKRGRRLVAEAVELCREDDHESLGRVAHVYGQFERDLGNREQALNFYLEGFNHYAAGMHPEKMAHALRHVADVRRDLGDREGSERDYRTAIEMYRNLDPAPAHSLANALRGFAILLERTGKRDEALQIFEEAHRLYVQVGNAPGIEEMGRRVKQLQK